MSLRALELGEEFGGGVSSHIVGHCLGDEVLTPDALLDGWLGAC